MNLNIFLLNFIDKNKFYLNLLIYKEISYNLNLVYIYLY